jgi:hypothetical protein
MRRVEVEAWVLDIADRVKTGQHIEDSRVELKADWPDAVKSARRIAGHANSSRGDDVLWIVGLDEARGVQGVAAGDTAAWWGTVRAQFDQGEPRMQDFVVPYDGLTLVALLFETDAAPFVVRNAVYGQQGAGSVEREVPWRDGTAVRSARRSDLIRLLVPKLHVPELEVLSARVNAEEDIRASGSSVTWSVWVTAYCRSHLDQPVVIPWHQVGAHLWVESAGYALPFTWHAITGHSITTGDSMSRMGPKVTAATIHTGSDQVIIEGPGLLYFRASASSALPDRPDDLLGQPAVLNFEWTALDSEQSQRFKLELRSEDPSNPAHDARRWRAVWAAGQS